MSYKDITFTLTFTIGHYRALAMVTLPTSRTRVVSMLSSNIHNRYLHRQAFPLHILSSTHPSAHNHPLHTLPVLCATPTIFQQTTQRVKTGGRVVRGGRALANIPRTHSRARRPTHSRTIRLHPRRARQAGHVVLGALCPRHCACVKRTTTSEHVRKRFLCTWTRRQPPWYGPGGGGRKIGISHR